MSSGCWGGLEVQNSDASNVTGRCPHLPGCRSRVAHPLAGGFTCRATSWHTASHLYSINLEHALAQTLIPTTTRPRPVFRPRHQSAFHRIIVTILDFFNDNLRGSTVVIIAPPLPHCCCPGLSPDNPIPLPLITSRPVQYHMGRTSLEYSDCRAEFEIVRWEYNQVHMLRHDDVSKDIDAAISTEPQQLCQYSLTRRLLGEQALATIATERDKAHRSQIIIVAQLRHCPRYCPAQQLSIAFVPHPQAGGPPVRLSLDDSIIHCLSPFTLIPPASRWGTHSRNSFATFSLANCYPHPQASGPPGEPLPAPRVSVCIPSP